MTAQGPNPSITVDRLPMNEVVRIAPKEGYAGCLVLIPATWPHEKDDDRLFMQAVLYVGCAFIDKDSAIMYHVPNNSSCVRVDLPEEQAPGYAEHPGTPRGVGGYVTPQAAIEAALRVYFRSFRPGDPVIVK